MRRVRERGEDGLDAGGALGAGSRRGVEVLEARGVAVSGVEERGGPRVLELAGHPFFFATLYVPQVRSRPGSPHTLVVALVEAARRAAPQPRRGRLVQDSGAG